jgi:hypothetical protein
MASWTATTPLQPLKYAYAHNTTIIHLEIQTATNIESNFVYACLPAVNVLRSKIKKILVLQETFVYV